MFLKILIFSIFFSIKTKNRFSKNLKTSQNPKNREIENLKFGNFWDFSKNEFLFWSKKFRKNQKFQKQILFFVLFLLCPRGVKFSSPRTGSESVCGVSTQKVERISPKFQFWRGQLRDPLVKRITKLMSEKASRWKFWGNKFDFVCGDTADRFRAGPRTWNFDTART